MSHESLLRVALEEVQKNWWPEDMDKVLLKPHQNSIKNWVAFEIAQKKRRHFVYIDGENMRMALQKLCTSDVWKDPAERYWLSAAAATACLRYCGVNIPGDNASVRYILYDKGDDVNQTNIRFDRVYSGLERRMGDAHASVRTKDNRGRNEMDDVLLLAAALARKRLATQRKCATRVYVVSGDNFKWMNDEKCNEWIKRSNGKELSDSVHHVKQLESRRHPGTPNILEWALHRITRELPRGTPCFVGLAAKAAHDTSISSLTDNDDDPCYEKPAEEPDTVAINDREVSAVLSNWDDAVSVSQSLMNAFSDQHLDSATISRLMAEGGGVTGAHAPATVTVAALLITMVSVIFGAPMKV